jgi:hypothetical protein
VGLGCCGAVLYTLRLAVRSPEVSWNKKSNPEPWNEYTNKQHKVRYAFSLVVTVSFIFWDVMLCKRVSYPCNRLWRPIGCEMLRFPHFVQLAQRWQ